MMLTIHGLPPKTSFQAVKTLIKQECNIIDFILDNLVDDGPNSKKVRIGVPDDTEGYRILKYLNGFRMSPTHLLKIVPVGKSLNPPPQQNYEQRPNYPEQRNDYPTQSRPEYQPPLENYNSGPDISKNIPNTQKPFMDTRKGNYVPPNMRPKKTGAPGSRDSGPLRPPEIRPHNLEQLHSQGPSGSHGSGPQASGSHVSGPLGSGPHGSRPHGSGPHGSGLHGSGPHGSGPHGSGPHGSGPHGSGPHGSGSHGPRPQGSGPLGVRPHSQDSRHPMGQGQQDMMNTPQWGSEMNSSNEWRPGPGNDQTQNYNQRPNQGGFGQQQQHMGPQDHYAQGRGSTGQGFGFQPKPNVPELVVPPQPQRDSRQHVLRAVDIVDTQAPARQYPPEKPITIMKDNFQGPQYSGPPSQHGNYAGQAQTQPVWQMNQQQKSQYDDRHPPMDKRSEVPKQDFDKRGQFVPITSSRPLSPRPGQDRSYQGSDRHMSPNRGFPERRVSPSRLGPPARELSPSGRRISPGRRYSPGRRMSPGRRFSPARKTSPGRKMSPGRRFSPGRKMSPGRRYSPGRKVSPGRRDDSRRMSPSMMQYDNYVEDERKFVRRDSPRRYSPGRGPSPSRRLLSPPRPRFSPNRLVDKSADKFLDDLKSSKPVRPAYEPPQAQNQSYTGGYRDTAPFSGRQESSWLNEKIIFPSSVKEDDRRDLARRLDKPADKSPGRQSRSPIKDRYRRHSPSPRSSRSPRRSWALEKRSPEPIREPPPPPLWPGQIADSKRKPTRFDPSTQETKHGNVWERLDETTPFQDKIRVRNDLEDIAPQRREFDDRRDHREVMDRKQIDRDREVRKNDRNEFRRQSPRRDDRVATKNVLSDIDKDFQDIYKRAVEFRKKTEERQKSGERRREEYDDRHKVDDFRREASPRRSRSRERGEWHVKDRKRIFLSPTVKAKRDKAIDEITNRIIDKYDLGGDQKYRVTEELRITISNLLMDMFSDKDVSFIELVIKYQAKYPDKEEQKLMQDVLSRLPKQYRNLKRKAEGERRYITKGPRLVHKERDRRYVTATSFKRSVSLLKRPASSRTEREIVKRPAWIHRTDSGMEVPVRRMVARKPEVAKMVRPSAKIVKDSLANPDGKKEASSVEPAVEGHYELSPLLSKMVDEELQEAMKKVWELQPTNPRDDAEKLVSNRFRNKAGELLRNVLGLNISKRLLNIHNPLYVKMVFAGKPLRADLVQFLKKYNICAFKRVGERGGTFAAKMRTFPDFDLLCTQPNLKCGKINVTVTPCYQFITCPPNLRTRYDGKETKKTDDVHNKSNVLSNTKTAKSGLTKENNANVQPNVVKQTNVTPAKPIEGNNAAAKSTVTNSQAPNKVAPKVTPVKAAENKPAAKETPKVAAVNTSQTKPAAPKVTPVKATENKPLLKEAPKGTTVKAMGSNAAAKQSNPNLQSDETSKVTPNKPAVSTTSQTSTPKQTANQNLQTTQTQKSAVKVTPAKTTQPQTQNTATKVTPAKITQAVTPNSATKVTTANTNQPQTSNTAPKVTPAKSNQPQTQNTATKVTPAKPTQALAPKVTPAKSNQPQTQNTATKVTPAKPTQALTPKVTPAKTNQPQTTATKVTPAKTNQPQTQNNATNLTLAKPAQVLTPNSATKVTPAKTNQPQTQNTATKVMPAKTNQLQTQNTATKVTPAKTNQAQTQNPVTKPAPVKQVANTTVTQNNANAAKAVPKPNIPAKIIPSKTATANNQKAVQKAPQAKQTVANKANTVKLTPKIVNKSKAPIKPKQAVPKKKPSDFDELDDHDILALISEGIVLDECSGSDVE